MAGSHIGTVLSFSPEGIITLSPPAVAPVFHKLSDVMYTVVNILIIITGILQLLIEASHCNGPLFCIFLLYSLPQPCEIGTIIVLIFQMWKMKNRDIMSHS